MKKAKLFAAVMVLTATVVFSTTMFSDGIQTLSDPWYGDIY